MWQIIFAAAIFFLVMGWVAGCIRRERRAAHRVGARRLIAHRAASMTPRQFAHAMHHDPELIAALQDKATMREVARQLRPDIDDAEFEVLWLMHTSGNPRNTQP